MLATWPPLQSLFLQLLIARHCARSWGLSVHQILLLGSRNSVHSKSDHQASNCNAAHLIGYPRICMGASRKDIWPRLGRQRKVIPKVIPGDGEESARQRVRELSAVVKKVEEAVCSWCSPAEPARSGHQREGKKGLLHTRPTSVGFGDKEGNGEPFKPSNQRKDMAHLCLKMVALATIWAMDWTWTTWTRLVALKKERIPRNKVIPSTDLMMIGWKEKNRYSGSCFSFWSRQMNCRRPGVLVHLSCYTGLTQTRGLINNRNVFLTILEAGNSKIKAPADAVSGRCQRTAISSLCLHMVEAIRQRALWVFFLIRALNPFIRAPSSWPKHLQKDPAPNGSTLGNTFQYMNFGGHKHSVYSPWGMKVIRSRKRKSHQD